eukprot:TRINITY_DN1017_c5_g1_i1.p1 TRINITY_DN1017_c5_g1~~TRINITY_DN1017_c5_g1_i1.p1  ORF type:complete len:1056 (+),score=489.27 TRINITY_DN1017_c5_g1_i1:178-3345(+)
MSGIGRKASVSSTSPTSKGKKSPRNSVGSPSSPRGDDMMKAFLEFKKPGAEGAIQILSDLHVRVSADDVSEIREKSSKDGELDFELFQDVLNDFIDKYERDEMGQKPYKRSQSMKTKATLDPAAMKRLNEPVPKGKETVRVVVRVRPFLPYEFKKAKDLGQTMDPVVFMTQKECQLMNTETGEANHSFKFDQCFWSIPEEQFPHDLHTSTQDDVFRYTGVPAVSHAFTGFNTCIFAYGQTGSGKTHSMLGNTADPGIAPRLIDMLFDRLREFKGRGEQTKFEVRVSFLEIYNEKVMDLLMNAPVPQGDEEGLTEEEKKERKRARKKSTAAANAGGDGYRECKVRNSPDKGTYVEGITRMLVTNARDTMNSMQAGMKYRAVASHSLNNQSSRSHAIFQICLKQTFLIGTTRVSNINIVDLAGSERVKMTHASGTVLDEAKNINQSLSTLRRVIDTLIENSKTRGKKIPPYRESMLTWVLKDSLGGNSKTVMIAAVSPHTSNYEDTLNTLRYALKAKSIVLHAHVNEEQTATMVSALKKELEALKHQMAHGGGGVADPVELQQAMEDLKKTETEAEEFKKKAETELKIKEEEVKEGKKKVFANVFKNAFAIEKKRMATEDAIAAKDREIEEMRHEMEATRREMDVIKDRASDKSAQDKKRAQRDADTIEELTEQVADGKKHEQELQGQVELGKMQTRKESIRADSIQGQVESLKSELSRLSNYSKDEVEKLKKENERLRGVEKDNTKLRLDIADHESDYNKLQKRCKQLEEDLANARKQIERLLDEKKELRSALEELQDVNSRKQEEMQKVKMEGEREVHVLQVEVEQKDSLIKCMRDEVRQMRTELDRTIDEKRKTEDAMSHLRSSQSKTHASLVLNANELEEQRQRIKDLERENSQTRQELDAAHHLHSSAAGTPAAGNQSYVTAGSTSSPRMVGTMPRAGSVGATDYALKGYMEDKFFPKGDRRQSDMQRASPLDSRVAGERVWVSNGYVYGPPPHRHSTPGRHSSPASRRSQSNTPSMSDAGRDSMASPRIRQQYSPSQQTSPRSSRIRTGLR